MLLFQCCANKIQVFDDNRLLRKRTNLFKPKILNYKYKIMSKTKATGGTHLGRDSRPKFLGVKLFDGQSVKIGSVIVRQRGSRILPGKNVKMGSDNTLYATGVGVVKFRQTKKTSFSGTQRLAKVVDVLATAKK